MSITPMFFLILSYTLIMKSDVSDKEFCLQHVDSFLLLHDLDGNLDFDKIKMCTHRLKRFKTVHGYLFYNRNQVGN